MCLNDSISDLARLIFQYFFDHPKMVLFCSLLVVETADRPGLLVDIVKVVTDISVAIESGEFDTEVAKLSLSLSLSCSICSRIKFLPLRVGAPGQGEVPRQLPRKVHHQAAAAGTSPHMPICMTRHSFQGIIDADCLSLGANFFKNLLMTLFCDYLPVRRCWRTA